ncbi:MAG: T9SS type A sorting domain-containing protein [Chitinophagales bacterium]|nr:T9SS type A sorting domain-containing protein [Chitinophagaceae bacterium]MCB9064177.1 T9SS type A sorting domain-containing protein [Chitinophagales bacterium]
MRKYLLLIAIFSLAIATTAKSQDRPIGQWRSHLPYGTAVSVATDGVKLYVATRYSFYTYNLANEEVTGYSKVSGMSDVGMSKIAYDNQTGFTILAYSNSNIDLFKDETFYNIPDLKLKTVTGTKAINDIYTENGLAYLSTDVGIVVLSLNKVEVKETYTFSKNSIDIAIKSLGSIGNDFYAATSQGLYRASKSNQNLQAFSEWKSLDANRDFNGLATAGGKVFASKSDSLFVLDNDTLKLVYESTDSNIVNIVNGIGCVWVLEYDDNTFVGIAKKLDLNYQFTDSFTTTGYATDLLDFPDADSSKWIPEQFTGLKKRTRKGDPFGTVIPEGPNDVGCFDVNVSNKEIVVAHGGYNDTYVPSNNGKGFSVYKNDEWDGYQVFQYPPFGDSVRDFTHIAKGSDGTIYAGSSQSGLFILKEDGSYEYLKQNSFIDPSTTGTTLYRVSGITFDNEGVLWVTIYGGDPHELAARTSDGQWYEFSVTSAVRGTRFAAAHITVDDFNQKWYAAPKDGGIIVYDDNKTPETPFDDQYIQLRAGDGAGGLPDNEVFCIVNDKDGSMWIGTANGIGIVNCPGQVMDRQCEAEKRVVQFDQFAGYLFQNEQVKTIAVDGANRKWIGTNNGVWLISESGDEIIERFTKDNSPLPSDAIQKIAIDPETGDVYIGTEMGLMSYRGTATDGGKENSDLITFPNPVPSGYSGTIAIKGFVENADVRITDISGQLIYKTTALGGQAIWNGKDYNGRRPQSGVYLIFATNRDGSQTKTGKLVFME